MFEKFIARIKIIFSKIERFIEEIGEPTYNFLVKLNEAIHNPALISAIKTTPTQADDKVHAFFIEYLPIVIGKLDVLMDSTGDHEDIDRFISHLSNRKDSYREMVLAKTGSMLCEMYIQNHGGPKVKRHEMDTMMQLTFEKMKAEA